MNWSFRITINEAVTPINHHQNSRKEKDDDRIDDDCDSDDVNKNQQVHYTDNDNNSIEDSDNEGDIDLPGLQEQTRDDSSNDDDSNWDHRENGIGPFVQRRDDDSHDDDSNNNYDTPHHNFTTSKNSILMTINWKHGKNDEYDGDNEDDDDDMLRLATWYSIDTPNTTSGTIPILQTSPLWLQ